MKMDEYNMIRREIEQKMSLQNTLLTFTITSTIAILTVVLKEDNISPFLFLLPLCILIPMSNRIAYYRAATAKLSAYLIVFPESENDSVKWETRNLQLDRFFRSKTKCDDCVRQTCATGIRDRKKRIFRLEYWECFVLSVVCYVLFVVTYYTQEGLDFCKITGVHYLWPAFLVYMEFRITQKINRVGKYREEYMEAWDNVKREGDKEYTYLINR